VSREIRRRQRVGLSPIEDLAVPSRMTEPDDPDLTVLLAEVGQEPSAWEAILPLHYGELRGIAARVLGERSPGQTLEPTELVHEAWERLQRREGFASREHFLALAAVAMRGLLVDRARRRGARKRGGNAERLTLHSRIGKAGRDPVDLLDLDQALEDLAQLDARQARVVELRTFGGMTVPEVSHLLNLAPSTVDLAWRTGRAWLRARLAGDLAS